MSIEAIKRIKEAEKQAEEMQKQAHIEARDLVKQAEEEAISILRSQEEQARQDADDLLLKVRQEAELEIGGPLREGTQRECDYIRQAAGEYIPEAVALVVGRTVNIHGDS